MLCSASKILLVTSLLILAPKVILAETEPAADNAGRALALETNVMWPFFPGGIAEFKVVVPTVARGQVLIGAHSDFKQKKRFDKGRINVKAIKLGYRQYLWENLHVETSANIGLRHEHKRPSTGENHNNMVISTWLFAGYQVDLGEYIYANARGGLGLIAYRSATWPGQEEGAFGAGDINLGVYF